MLYFEINGVQLLMGKRVHGISPGDREHEDLLTVFSKSSRIAGGFPLQGSEGVYLFIIR